MSGIVFFSTDQEARAVEFYRERVAATCDSLVDVARGPPEENDQFEAYQFFAEDPDGRTVEFQTFLHPLPECPRRSVTDPFI